MARFRIGFKTPDAARDALEEFEHDETGVGDAAAELLEKYVRYGECVTLEFDTEAKTATVVPV